MYLLGIYLAFTGLVSERLRSRVRQAMQTARELVDSLEQKKLALETQARDLEEAGRRAEQANLAKAQFLATISHEIRTPMNGMLGTTELLLETRLDPVQRHLAETANQSATALLALIDDVLDLSRIEASKLTLNTTSFDLRALVHEAVDLMTTTARGKPVALSSTISWRLPNRVEGDPIRLRQVLVNLLHNAVNSRSAGASSSTSASSARPRTRCSCVSRCATPASASPRTSSTRCSTRSRRSTRRARGAMAAPASAWQSSRRSPS